MGMNPLRLGIFGALQDVSDRQQARQQAKDAKALAAEERSHKRTLEEAMLKRQSTLDARQATLDQAGMRSRTLEDALKQAEIGKVRAQTRSVGVPKMQKPTQQNNTAEFLREGAERAVKTLEGYHAPAKTWVRNVPGLGNYGMSAQDQVAQQAAETLHDAYLRITTGATINKDELARAARQYIAQPGDSEPVLQAKALRRAEIIRAIRHLSAPARGVQAGGEPNEPDEQLPFSAY